MPVRTTTQDGVADQVVREVRDRYGEIAETSGSCCGPKASPCCGKGQEVSLQIGYAKKDLSALPEGADLGLGCGAPISLLDLKPGETVLDLGSGAGIDAFLAAEQVGPEGRVIGVDMTPQMLERARRNAARAGHDNVEFREGRLESLPVEDGSVDAVTSNCVINLVPDKATVFAEVARVLRPGGRMVVSDIVLDAPLPEVVRADIAAWVGCISGAMRKEEYVALVEESGLGQVEVLRDSDYGASMEAVAPDQVRELLERTGAKREDLVGTIRSVTVRAVKTAEALRSPTHPRAVPAHRG
jgi:arsenite methyltransferase